MSHRLSYLLVEDNRGDVVFFSEAVRAADTPADVRVVPDGLAAMKYLRQEDQHAGAPRPDLIVLDLNLPVKSGKEVLAELRAEPALDDIPIAVLTTSTSEAHLAADYPNGRCLYFTKTADFRKLVGIVKKMEAFARTRHR